MMILFIIINKIGQHVFFLNNYKDSLPIDK